MVLKPDVSISTPAVFRDPNLPRNTPKRTMEALLNAKWENDCEKVVRDHYFEVEELMSKLVKYATFRLTGTGACIFAEFDSFDEANTVFVQRPDNVFGFVAKGHNLSPLHQRLF